MDNNSESPTPSQAPKVDMKIGNDTIRMTTEEAKEYARTGKLPGDRDPKDFVGVTPVEDESKP